MRATRFVKSAVLIAALFSAAGTIPAAAASHGADTQRTTRPPLIGTTISDEKARAAVEFWTPERMAEARPAPVRTARQPANAALAPTEDLGGPLTLASPGIVAASDTIGAGVTPQAGPDAAQKAKRTLGRVFITPDNNSSVKYYCSATALNTPNQSLVWTAAHCMSEGDGSPWYDHWVFVPGYGLDGPASHNYGKFPAVRMEAYSEYYFNGNAHYDIGAVVVGKSDGARLVARIGGGQGLVANLPRDSYYNAMGYPGTGDVQKSCEGHPGNPSVDSDNGWGQPYMMEMSCSKLTKGSSGGPWLVNMDCNATCPVTGYGYVASVVSQGGIWNNQLLTIYGPYQTSLANTLLNMLKSVPV